jgi:hypothetical protein
VEGWWVTEKASKERGWEVLEKMIDFNFNYLAMALSKT